MPLSPIRAEEEPPPRVTALTIPSHVEFWHFKALRSGMAK